MQFSTSQKQKGRSNISGVPNVMTGSSEKLFFFINYIVMQGTGALHSLLNMKNLTRVHMWLK